jgi:CRISPR system Cascade subunit CasA
MSRRISLVFEESKAVCDLCGLQAAPVVTRYATLPHGNKYEGPWRHPLTPYCITAQGEPRPISGTADGTRYRHWLGLTLGQTAGKVAFEPAEVVRIFAARCKDLDEGEREFRIRAYGYEMDKNKPMKARGFCFGDMPVWSLAKPKIRQAFAFEVQRLLSAADYVAWQLRNAAFNAIVHAHRGGRNRKALARRTIFQAFVDRFWRDTEPGFYALLPELHQAALDQEETLPIREAWRSRLAAAALSLFDQAASTISIGTGDVKRVAKSQQALRRAVGPWSREMRKRLDLPEPVAVDKQVEEGAVA